MRRHDLTERLLLLRGVPVFRSMTTTELAPLAETMHHERFEKDAVILREDEPPRACHLIVSGAVTMRRHGLTLRTIRAPGGVGFVSLLAKTSGGTEAVAESRTETFVLRSDAIDELFEDNFAVLLGTFRWVSERLIQETLTQDLPRHVVTPADVVPPSDVERVASDLECVVGERQLGLVERMFVVRRSTVFMHANVNSTARLARAMRELRLPAGETIWRPGDPSLSSLLIVKGKASLAWRGVNGRTVQTLGPGSMIGVAESIANRPRWNQLVTTEPVVFLQASRESIIDVLEDDLEVALQFLSMLAAALLAIWDRKAEADALASGESEGLEPRASEPS